MFNSHRNNIIESDEGFYVEMLGRTGIKYVEGPRTVFIDSEILMGPHGMAIQKNSIKNWQIPDGDIDDAKRDKMIKDARKVSYVGGSTKEEMVNDVHVISSVGEYALFDGFKIDETIDADKRDEIAENVRRAFLYQGFDVEID